MNNTDIHIMVFGQLAEITGTANLRLPFVADSDLLKAALLAQFPAMGKVNFIIAVDKKPATKNVTISSESVIALLPPFSGG